MSPIPGTWNHLSYTPRTGWTGAAGTPACLINLVNRISPVIAIRALPSPARTTRGGGTRLPGVPLPRFGSLRCRGSGSNGRRAQPRCRRRDRRCPTRVSVPALSSAPPRHSAAVDPRWGPARCPCPRYSWTRSESELELAFWGREVRCPVVLCDMWKRCGLCCLACDFLVESLWAFCCIVGFGLIYPKLCCVGVELRYQTMQLLSRMYLGCYWCTGSSICVCGISWCHQHPWINRSPEQELSWL